MHSQPHPSMAMTNYVPPAIAMTHQPISSAIPHLHAHPVPFYPLPNGTSFHLTTHITTHTTTQHHDPNRMMAIAGNGVHSIGMGPTSSMTYPSLPGCVAHTTATFHTTAATTTMTGPASMMGPSTPASAAVSSQPFVDHQLMQHIMQLHQQTVQAQAQSHWDQLQLLQRGIMPPALQNPSPSHLPMARPISTHQSYPALPMAQPMSVYSHSHSDPSGPSHSSASVDPLRQVMQQSMDAVSISNRPARGDEVARLVRSTVIDPSKLPHPTCTVCLADFEVDDQYSTMPCQHSFHPTCIETWLAIRNTCPCCRYQLLTDDANYNHTIRRGAEGDLPMPMESSPRAVESSSPSSAPSTEGNTRVNQTPSSASAVIDATNNDDDDDEVTDDNEDDDDDESDVDEDDSMMSMPRSSSSNLPSSLASILPPSVNSRIADMDPLLQYHTLHHLQTVAAAEFNTLARQAQHHQQQQQSLLHYQHQLWQAQRQLQAAIMNTDSDPRLIQQSTTSQSQPPRATEIHSSNLSAQDTNSTTQQRIDLLTPSLPISSLPTSLSCSLCSSSDLSSIHNPSCTLSCGHSFHVNCWSSHLLQQRRPSVNNRSFFSTLVACPQCPHSAQSRRHRHSLDSNRLHPYHRTRPSTNGSLRQRAQSNYTISPVCPTPILSQTNSSQPEESIIQLQS